MTDKLKENGQLTNINVGVDYSSIEARVLMWLAGEMNNLAYTHDYCVDDFERQRGLKPKGPKMTDSNKQAYKVRVWLTEQVVRTMTFETPAESEDAAYDTVFRALAKHDINGDKLNRGTPLADDITTIDMSELNVMGTSIDIKEIKLVCNESEGLDYETGETSDGKYFTLMNGFVFLREFPDRRTPVIAIMSIANFKAKYSNSVLGKEVKPKDKLGEIYNAKQLLTNYETGDGACYTLKGDTVYLRRYPDLVCSMTRTDFNAKYPETVSDEEPKPKEEPKLDPDVFWKATQDISKY